MSSVNSTKNRYSKEQKQQRSRVLTAQRTKTTIHSITMRTTTKHSWSPQDLITRLHARRSCASSSWIGQRVCVPVDCDGLDMRFLPLRGFSFRTLLRLLQPLFVFGNVCQFLSRVVFSYHATLHPSFGWSAYELSPFGNHFQLLKVFHFYRH